MKKVFYREYEEMLDVLPPEDYYNTQKGWSGFLVGEPLKHNEKGEGVYSAYAKYIPDSDTYYLGAMTKEEFRSALNRLAEDNTPALNAEYSEKDQEEADLRDEYSDEAVDAWLWNFNGDLDIDDFREAYYGEFESDEEFAQQLAEDIGAIDSDASWPNNCIDWEYAAKELMYDYWEHNNYYFRNI